MKKFSKITENKQFLGWSKKRIENEFINGLNPQELEIHELYVCKNVNENNTSEVVDISNIPEYHLEDCLFSPMFLVSLSLGNIPEKSFHHEIDNHQVDNWAGESIKFEMVREQFDKFANFLDKFKEDFYISLESGSTNNLVGLFMTRSEASNSSESRKNKQYLVNMNISLVMKDSFEYEQIK